MTERDHWAASPGRRDLYSAVATVLGEGYALQPSELNLWLPYYGYSRTSEARNVINPGAKQVLKNELGVEFREERYKGKLLFYDAASPDSAEADLAAAKLIIDAAAKTRALKLRANNPDLVNVALVENRYKRLGLATRQIVDQPGTAYAPDRHGGVRLFTTAGCALIRLDASQWQKLLPGHEIIIGDKQLHEARVVGELPWEYIFASTVQEMKRQGL